LGFPTECRIARQQAAGQGFALIRRHKGGKNQANISIRIKLSNLR